MEQVVREVLAIASIMAKEREERILVIMANFIFIVGLVKGRFSIGYFLIIMQFLSWNIKITDSRACSNKIGVFKV